MTNDKSKYEKQDLLTLEANFTANGDISGLRTMKQHLYQQVRSDKYRISNLSKLNKNNFTKEQSDDVHESIKELQVKLRNDRRDIKRVTIQLDSSLKKIHFMSFYQFNSEITPQLFFLLADRPLALKVLSVIMLCSWNKKWGIVAIDQRSLRDAVATPKPLNVNHMIADMIRTVQAKKKSMKRVNNARQDYNQITKYLSECRIHCSDKHIVDKAIGFIIDHDAGDLLKQAIHQRKILNDKNQDDQGMTEASNQAWVSSMLLFCNEKTSKIHGSIEKYANKDITYSKTISYLRDLLNNNDDKLINAITYLKDHGEYEIVTQAIHHYITPSNKNSVADAIRYLRELGIIAVSKRLNSDVFIINPNFIWQRRPGEQNAKASFFTEPDRIHFDADPRQCRKILSISNQLVNVRDKSKPLTMAKKYLDSITASSKLRKRVKNRKSKNDIFLNYNEIYRDRYKTELDDLQNKKNLLLKLKRIFPEDNQLINRLIKRLPKRFQE